MKLIVGFGNPENKYNFTRHNFGFLALDLYAKINKLDWEKNPKFDAIWLKTDTYKIGLSKNDHSEQLILIKPQTYYNEVGKAIQAFSRFYKIKPEDILIICDDFNLAFGQIRYRKNGSAGGNNGLKSTIAELNTSDFPRLRLGTGSELRKKTGDIDFVLSKFAPAEKEQLPSILRDVASKINEIATTK